MVFEKVWISGKEGKALIYSDNQLFELRTLISKTDNNALNRLYNFDPDVFVLDDAFYSIDKIKQIVEHESKIEKGFHLLLVTLDKDLPIELREKCSGLAEDILKIKKIKRRIRGKLFSSFPRHHIEIEAYKEHPNCYDLISEWIEKKDLIERVITEFEKTIRETHFKKERDIVKKAESAINSTGLFGAIVDACTYNRKNLFSIGALQISDYRKDIFDESVLDLTDYFFQKWNEPEVETIEPEPTNSHSGLFTKVRERSFRDGNLNGLRKYVERNNHIRVWYPGYMSGDFTQSDKNMPEIIEDYIFEFRDQVKTLFQFKNPIEIVYVESINWDKLLDNIEDGTLLIPELTYGSDRRGEKLGLIQVGSISEVSVIGQSRLINKLKNTFDFKKSTQVDNFKTIFDLLTYCKTNNVELICQNSTSISDQLTQNYQKSVFSNLTVSSEDLPIVQIDKTKVISRNLQHVSDKNRSIALLDVLTAEALAKEAGDLEVFPVRYSEPIPVGFPFPIENEEYMELIYKVILNTIYSSTWDSRFINRAMYSKVKLSDFPVPIMLLPGEGWKEVNIDIKLNSYLKNEKVSLKNVK